MDANTKEVLLAAITAVSSILNLFAALYGGQLIKQARERDSKPEATDNSQRDDRS